MKTFEIENLFSNENGTYIKYKDFEMNHVYSAILKNNCITIKPNNTNKSEILEKFNSYLRVIIKYHKIKCLSFKDVETANEFLRFIFDFMNSYKDYTPEYDFENHYIYLFKNNTLQFSKTTLFFDLDDEYKLKINDFQVCEKSYYSFLWAK